VIDIPPMRNVVADLLSIAIDDIADLKRLKQIEMELRVKELLTNKVIDSEEAERVFAVIKKTAE